MMQYEPSHNFRQNLDALIHFPKNNDNAMIKADKNETLYSQASSGYFSGFSYFSTPFDKTVPVIQNTCKDTIFEIGKTLQQAKESGSFENATKAREFYLKASQALDSLKEIHKVYNKRNEPSETEAVKNLEETIQGFEEDLKNFAVDERHIEEMVSDIASKRLVIETSNDLGMSFLQLEVEPGKAFVGVEQDYPQLPVTGNSSWWGTYGEGPTALGKIASGINTAKELAIGTFSAYAYTPSKNPLTASAQKRVANPGRQLGGGDVNNYIIGINKDVPVNSIYNFYLTSGTEINTMTLDQIKTAILSQSKYFDNPNLSLLIPVAFGGEGIWERNHIAVILIKDNCVEYYDAKGILSDHRKLANDTETLHDVLEFCRDTFTKAGVIAENPYAHQYDAHNCGVFVCRHINDRLVKNNPMGTLQVNPPTLAEVEKFREEVIKVAYPLEEFNIQPFDGYSSKEDF